MSNPSSILAITGTTAACAAVASTLDSDDELFEVMTVSTADEAEELLADDRTEYDCLLAGEAPSGTDGIAFVQASSRRWPDLPVIFVTDGDRGDIADDAIAAGATDCFRWSPDSEQSAIVSRRVQNAVDAASSEDDHGLKPREYATVLDHAQSGILLVDVEAAGFRYHSCNKRMCELAGMSVDEIRGKTPQEAFGTADGDQIAERYRACVERYEPIEYTVTVDLPGGRSVREGVVRPIGGDGGTERLLVTVQEVTAHREREAELERSKTRLKALYERSPDMINVHDGDGRILEVNPLLCEKTGYDEATLTDMRIWDLDRSADRERATSFWAEMNVGDRRRFEGEWVCADGSMLPVEVHLRRLDTDGDDRFVAISRDITETRDRERELRQQNERLDDFASVVSHDLRNPLQVLRGALDGVEATGEQAHIDRGRRAVDRMENLVNDLLVLARQGDTDEDRSTVSIRTSLEGCWQQIEQADATLSVDTDQQITVSETRFRQLGENLLQNAVEHSSGDTTIRVGTLDEGFYVADDGPGIPASERDVVFESGFSTDSEGTGFGLAIVERVADAHGWTVELTESESGGARFEFTDVEVV